MNVLRSGGRVCLLVIGLVVLGASVAPARTLTVSPGDKSGISGALAAANFGDVVLVSPGIYYEQAMYFPDGVTLQGTTGIAQDVEIVTAGPISAFIMDGAGPMTLIADLTVRFDDQGMMPADRGAGAYLSGASPVFSNVVFLGLESSYGGAVYCADGSAPIFSGCRFSGNYAMAVGGAVACVGASAPEFQQCLFEDNLAEISGGTINAALGSAPSLTECTIVQGAAAVGSGLASWDGGLVLDRVIITGGLDGRAWDGDAPSAPAPDCSDIFGNAGGDWVGALASYAALNGNISLDPEYCGAADSDHPYSLNAASPCAVAACGPMGAFGVGCDFVSEVGGGSSALPAVSQLYDNYPNPFNPRTTIKFDLKQAGPVELSVFDIGGRLVNKLVSQTMPAGQHEAAWEGRDSSGRAASAGVYFFRLKTKDILATKRMTLVK